MRCIPKLSFRKDCVSAQETEISIPSRSDETVPKAWVEVPNRPQLGHAGGNPFARERNGCEKFFESKSLERWISRGRSKFKKKRVGVFTQKRNPLHNAGRSLFFESADTTIHKSLEHWISRWGVNFKKERKWASLTASNGHSLLDSKKIGRRHRPHSSSSSTSLVTIWAEMITEMRGADLIFFRENRIRNIRNLMRV